MSNRVAALLFAAGMTLAAPVSAQGTAPDQQQAPDGPVARLHLAAELHALARRSEDPMLALAAARLAMAVPLREQARQGETGEGRSVASDPVGSGPVAEMLETARGLAAGQPQLLALIDQAAGGGAVAARGRVAGAVATRLRIDPGQLTLPPQEMVFRGGERAEVAIEGDGSGDLDLVVMDEVGTVICQQTGPRDREFCAWTPRWTGPFVVRIINLARQPNVARLLTN